MRAAGVTSKLTGLPSRVLGAALCGLWLLAGCETPQLDYREVKRIHEPVLDAEVRAFRQIVEALPDKRLPVMTPLYLPVPDWAATRTLPVGDLAEEEQTRLRERWDEARLAKEWSQNKPLARLLRRERMTLEQFSGLTLTLAAALSRTQLKGTEDLNRMMERGAKEIARLREDKRSFALIPENGRYQVLQRAISITRAERAHVLSQVPGENQELVQRLGEDFAKMFPDEFRTNPMAGIADLLEDQGLPFEELATSGHDDEIEWRTDEAIIGHDPPDALPGQRFDGDQ